MTEQRRADAQDELPGIATSATPPTRATEAAVRAALVEANLDARDRGTGELAAGLARAVDLGLARRDPYAVAAAGRELSTVLARLRMDPESRDAQDDDPFLAFQRQLAEDIGGPGNHHGADTHPAG